MRSTTIRPSTDRWRARRSKRGSRRSRPAFSNSRTARPEVAERPRVRVAAFVDFPYRLFYRVNEATIEVVAIRRALRSGRCMSGSAGLAGSPRKNAIADNAVL